MTTSNKQLGDFEWMHIGDLDEEFRTNSMEVKSKTEVWNRSYKGILKAPLENGSGHLGT